MTLKILITIALILLFTIIIAIQQTKLNSLEEKINKIGNILDNQDTSDDTTDDLIFITKGPDKLTILENKVKFLETKQKYWINYFQDFEIRLAEDGVSKSKILPYKESELTELIRLNNVHVGDRWPNGLMVTKIDNLNFEMIQEAIGKVKITGNYIKFPTKEEAKNKYNEEEFDKYLSNHPYRIGETCITSDQETPYGNFFCLLEKDKDQLTKEEGRVELYITKLLFSYEGPKRAEVTNMVEK